MVFLSRLTVWVLAGAALGLALGFLLVALDVVDNPFWWVSGGIMAGAVLMPLHRAVTRPDDAAGGPQQR